MMQLSWTLLATAIYMLLAVIEPRSALLLVPLYCFAVVLPYGIRLCERRWRGYRGRHHGERQEI